MWEIFAASPSSWARARERLPETYTENTEESCNLDTPPKAIFKLKKARFTAKITSYDKTIKRAGIISFNIPFIEPYNLEHNF